MNIVAFLLDLEDSTANTTVINSFFDFNLCTEAMDNPQSSGILVKPVKQDIKLYDNELKR